MNISVSLKSEAHEISVYNIIVHTDNQQLNLKAIEVTNYLADFCKEMNFSLIDNWKRMESANILTTAGLNKKWSTILSDVYCKEITKVFKWSF